MGGITMVQFNLDEFLKDRRRKVVTRSGLPVQIKGIYFSNPSYPVKAEINNLYTRDFTENGLYQIDSETEYDLFFATEKHVGWINTFRGPSYELYIRDFRIFRSKEDAEESAKTYRVYVKPIRIEWED